MRITQKFNIVEVIGCNGASKILSCHDFNKATMTKRQWKKIIFAKYGNAVSEIVF